MSGDLRKVRTGDPLRIPARAYNAFVDAAHLWNEGSDDVEFDPGSGFEIGRTLGSAGLGLRMNIYGGIVLRYDFGYRFPDGFEWEARQPFGQFFFGWDF